MSTEQECTCGIKLPLILYVKDHPEANGRKPLPGEHGYILRFPLASGTSLEVRCGTETLNKFREFLGSLAIDEEAERP